ncbi:MAG: hypothetical protein MK188_05735 [Gammaproteobacteria bacterium]|nr:hypothetical protein [Gammaproteobacteria bacterium]
MLNDAKISGQSSLDIALINSNISVLDEGIELIRLLEEGQYTKGFKPAFQSTIGAHFRHLLEHYRCFFTQMASKVFCYDLRERDQLLERDSAYALATIEELKRSLSRLSEGECGTDRYQIQDEQTSRPADTSLNRELLFLQSHTVHHYAIIAAMTRAFGKQPEQEFGVAIATRVHNEKSADEQSNVVAVKEATCAQ